MIDCESEVYTRVATVLREEFPGINVTGEYVPSPSAFPHVSITMSDNVVVRSLQTSGDRESITEMVFEVNIYSNKTDGRKTECKAVLKKIDEVMFSMNMFRIAMTPMPVNMYRMSTATVPTLEDTAIYRIVSRYRCTTDGTRFYRR